MIREDIYEMYFDGCSKGNPGLSGAGAVIYKNGQEIWSNSYFVSPF
jgi:ribonuclease HI